MCQPGRPGPHGLVPGRLARLGPLPQREVERALLLLAHLDARARLQVVDALARQLAVARRSSGTAIVDVAAGGVGEPLRLQALDDVDDLGDVLGRARLEVGGAQAERAEVDLHLLGVLARHLVGGASSPRFALLMILSSTSVMLRTKRSVVAARAQVADDDVERDLLRAWPMWQRS